MLLGLRNAHSPGSRSKRYLKLLPPLVNKTPKLWTSFTRRTGRGLFGNRTVFSKGRALLRPVFKKTITTPVGLYSVCLHVKTTPTRFQTAAVGVMQNALGAWAQTPVTLTAKPLDYFCSPSPGLISQDLARLPIEWMWRLRQLPTHTRISLLAEPGSLRARAVLSPGSFALLVMNGLWGYWTLTLLPSGQAKFYSDEATALGSPLGPSFKRFFRLTKASNHQRRGICSRVRGTVMNPNDHPHGGRTRAIKYPRTPWGKTAKKSRAPAPVVALRPLAKRLKPLEAQPLAAVLDEPTSPEPLPFYVAPRPKSPLFGTPAVPNDGRAKQ